jgi:DNA-directed RNA polymerase subunit RPC12/RpoP
MAQDPKEEATRLLTHYLKNALTGAGFKWNGDCDTEVAAIVENLVQAATAHTVREIERLSRQAQERMASMQSGASVPCEQCGANVIYKERSLEQIGKDHKPECPVGKGILAEAQKGQQG